MGKHTNRTNLLICLALVLITLAVYWQVVGFGFVNYDDEVYIERNSTILQGLTLYGAGRALVTHYQSNWHPLTWMSLMLDAQIGGGSPAVFHATNVVLHIANTLLLFLLLTGLTGSRWRSAFVAALFALHPLHVESVAWVTERKDVLSTLFWLLTMIAYVHWVRQPNLRRYVLVAAAFALGLMAKPMLVSLPFVLLLIDVWPLKRSVGWSRLVREKTPLFAMSAASCVVTFWAQNAGRSVQDLTQLPVGERVANALVSYSAYLVKMVHPKDLVPIYLHPGHTLPVWQVIGSAVFLAAMTAVAVRLRRGRPYVTVGWLWYVVTLVPVIGLVQVGQQAMADRYTYVPLIGSFIMLAWLIPEAAEKCPVCARMPGRTSMRLAALAVAVLCVLAALTYVQASYWRDGATLFGHTLAVNPNNHLAHIGVGNYLLAKGENEAAIDKFEVALRIKDDPLAHYNMGMGLEALGRKQEAAAQFAYALKCLPDKPDLHIHYGVMLGKMGRSDDAIWHFRKALRKRPNDAVALHNLACAYMQKGDVDSAVEQYEAIVKLDPTNKAAQANLTRARAEAAEREGQSGDSKK